MNTDYPEDMYYVTKKDPCQGVTGIPTFVESARKTQTYLFFGGLSFLTNIIFLLKNPFALVFVSKNFNLVQWSNIRN